MIVKCSGNHKQRFDLCVSRTLYHEASVVLQTNRHSVRIFSNGACFAIRPDFSAWDD